MPGTGISSGFRNPTLGNRVLAAFTFLKQFLYVCNCCLPKTDRALTQRVSVCAKIILSVDDVASDLCVKRPKNINVNKHVFMKNNKG